MRFNPNPRNIFARTSAGPATCVCHGHDRRRWLRVSSGSMKAPDQPSQDLIATTVTSGAKFEVLGAPYSLLSVSLEASQNLYTRRGTLVGLSGKAGNVISTLASLEPLRRALLGIPFLYQKISSASPIIALISTRSPLTSFTTVHLDGTIDWMIAQRRALLAWTGSTLSIKPRVNTSLSLAHWGSSQITGRGILALVGAGQIFEVKVPEGETYIVHPSNLVAYSMEKYAPMPYRLKASTLRFQIPGTSLDQFLPDTNFTRVIRSSSTWKGVSNVLHTIRTLSRRVIWGDRLFLQFHGPTTILLQSRASRLNDVLSSRETNEIADTPAGETLSRKPASSQITPPRDASQDASQDALQDAPQDASLTTPFPDPVDQPTRLNVATVDRGGKVMMKEVKDFKEFS